MSQPATTITTVPHTTLTLIDPTQDNTAQIVPDEPTVTALEERQNLLAHHVKLVARGMSVGLFVFGSHGGLGKSRTVLRTLAEEGVSPVLVNSHITPLALYSTLYFNRTGKVVFFDDVDAVFSSMAHLGLLRSALWGDPRIVTYGSSQLDDLPGSFIFESRIVFCANVIPRKNDAFKAVLSRCDIFELNATQEEVLDLMRSVARAGYETLTPSDCLDVVSFIENNGDDRAISLRLLEPSFRKVIYARSEGLDWRPLVLTQLKTLGRKEDTSRKVWDSYSRLLLRGRDPEPLLAGIIKYALLWVRYDRKIGGRARTPDIYDYRAGFKQQSLSDQGEASPSSRSDADNPWIDFNVQSNDDPAALAIALEETGVTLSQWCDL